MLVLFAEFDAGSCAEGGFDAVRRGIHFVRCERALGAAEGQ